MNEKVNHDLSNDISAAIFRLNTICEDIEGELKQITHTIDDLKRAQALARERESEMNAKDKQNQRHNSTTQGSTLVK